MKVFISDCEGPISKNDNAFELTAHFLPDGDNFFSLISKYDDVLAEVIKRPKYESGYTLKLIVPFLRAYGATNEAIREYSAKTIMLVQGARDMLLYVKTIMPSFIVSTSYEPYISSLCNVTDFPLENVYSTSLDLDKYHISEREVKRLKTLREEIAAYPMIEIPEGAKSIHDLSKRDQDTVTRLNKIFWEEIQNMKSGRILEEVNPVGGDEKAKAVLEIVKKQGVSLKDVIYVGDSITDVKAFRLVRDGRGLTVSFNGNRYAVQAAEIAVISKNAIATSILADTFSRLDKEDATKFVKAWSPSALETYSFTDALKKKVLNFYPEDFPKVQLVTSDNLDRLAMESSIFRKTIRGEAIGRLG